MTDFIKRYLNFNLNFNPNFATNQNYEINHSNSIDGDDVPDVFHVGSVVWANGKVSFHNS